MVQHPDKRQEYRLTAHEVVYIQTSAASVDNTEPSRIIISNSLDISANGMRITSSEDLVIGSIYPTCVQLESPSCRLQLVTEVKWSKKLESGNEYSIGLEIFESDGTDIQKWKEIIAERCNL
ncbi:PilZ domain-containing protein [Spartinivicinus ruber]|uniref:PilZ domain-containing protein n=1 Tax=Spartinivicinus ruber TaxID=2683272 RepID=UPI0013D3FD2F|nr:PilZ domain-containing protein [Spartinivicinus ruber]